MFVLGNAIIPVALSSAVMYIAFSHIIITTHTTQHRERHKHRMLTEQISYIVCACPIFHKDEKI